MTVAVNQPTDHERGAHAPGHMQTRCSPIGNYGSIPSHLLQLSSGSLHQSRLLPSIQIHPPDFERGTPAPALGVAGLGGSDTTAERLEQWGRGGGSAPLTGRLAWVGPSRLGLGPCAVGLGLPCECGAGLAIWAGARGARRWVGPADGPAPSEADICCWGTAP